MLNQVWNHTWPNSREHHRGAAARLMQFKKLHQPQIWSKRRVNPPCRAERRVTTEESLPLLLSLLQTPAAKVTRSSSLAFFSSSKHTTNALAYWRHTSLMRVGKEKKREDFPLSKANTHSVRRTERVEAQLGPALRKTDGGMKAEINKGGKQTVNGMKKSLFAFCFRIKRVRKNEHY